MFNKENIIAGIASILDIFGTQSPNQNENPSDEHGTTADYESLKSDWTTIGNDISETMGKCRHNNKQGPPIS